MSKEFITRAQPNHYALDRIFDQDHDRMQIVRIPVIAWRIANSGDGTLVVDPICYETLSSLFYGDVERPDGTITNRKGRMWDSFKSYVLSQVEDAKKRPDGMSLCDYEAFVKAKENSNAGV